MRTRSPVDSAEAGPAQLDDGPESVACRLTIFIRETDHYRHGPLYAEIVHRAHKAGLAGASAFRGVQGFSAPDYPQGRRWSLYDNVPVMIVIVDEKERIEAFLPLLDEVMDGGMAILETIQVRS